MADNDAHAAVEHDDLLTFVDARNREDKQRASSAGESRQKIGAFLDETGLNSQALSWCRTIVKKLDKDAGELKAMDVIRSLELLLPMISDHVTGQQGALPIGDPSKPAKPAPAAAEITPFD